MCRPQTDDRKPKKIPLNAANSPRRSSRPLWRRINHKAVYQVEFDSSELVAKRIHALDKHLKVAAMQYVVQAGTQRDALEADDLTSGAGFDVSSTATHTATVSAASQVRYDLLGEITEKLSSPVVLRRQSSAESPGDVRQVPAQSGPVHHRGRPAHQRAEGNRDRRAPDLRCASKTGLDTAIFTENQTKQDLTHAGNKLTVTSTTTSSQIPRSSGKFVTELDTPVEEVAVYAKLPRDSSSRPP